ncbi:MAG: hypothetical protein ACRBCT_00360 [Alphaproteobacteria bacterium]
MSKNTDETNILLKEISDSLKTAEGIARKSQFHNYLESMGFKVGVKPLQIKKPSKSADTIKRNTLLKMIIGMAIGGYGYDPTKNRNTTAREIQSDLALQGINLDEDTIRNWLKEAASFLPNDSKE